eukprot:2274022-Rhodomonas_salina.4
MANWRTEGRDSRIEKRRRERERGQRGGRKGEGEKSVDRNNRGKEEGNLPHICETIAPASSNSAPPNLTACAHTGPDIRDVNTGQARRPTAPCAE